MCCVFGVGQLLRTRGLRQLANRMAYHDKDRLATEDAMRVGRLHTHCPGARVVHVEHVHHCEECAASTLGDRCYVCKTQCTCPRRAHRQATHRCFKHI